MRISCYARIGGSLSGCQKHYCDTKRSRNRRIQWRSGTGNRRWRTGGRPRPPDHKPGRCPGNSGRAGRNGGARRGSRRIFRWGTRGWKPSGWHRTGKWIQYWTGPRGRTLPDGGDGQLFRWYPAGKPDRSGNKSCRSKPDREYRRSSVCRSKLRWGNKFLQLWDAGRWCCIKCAIWPGWGRY